MIPGTPPSPAYRLRMLCINVPLQVVLPCETSFNAIGSMVASDMMAVEAATIVLSFVSIEILLK